MDNMDTQAILTAFCSSVRQASPAWQHAKAEYDSAEEKNYRDLINKKVDKSDMQYTLGKVVNFVQDKVKGGMNSLVLDEFKIDYELRTNMDKSPLYGNECVNISAPVKWERQKVVASLYTSDEGRGVLLNTDLGNMVYQNKITDLTKFANSACLAVDTVRSTRPEEAAKMLRAISLFSRTQHKLTRLVKGCLLFLDHAETGAKEYGPMGISGQIYNVQGLLNTLTSPNAAYVYNSNDSSFTTAIILQSMCEAYPHPVLGGCEHISIPSDALNVFVVGATYDQNQRPVSISAATIWGTLLVYVEQFRLQNDLELALAIACSLRENRYYSKIKLPKVVSGCDYIFPCLAMMRDGSDEKTLVSVDASKVIGRVHQMLSLVLVKDLMVSCDNTAVSKFQIDSSLRSMFSKDSNGLIQYMTKKSCSEILKLTSQMKWLEEMGHEDFERMRKISVLEGLWLIDQPGQVFKAGVLKSLKAGYKNPIAYSDRSVYIDSLSVLQKEVALSSGTVVERIPNGGFNVRLACFREANTGDVTEDMPFVGMMKDSFEFVLDGTSRTVRFDSAGVASCPTQEHAFSDSHEYGWEMNSDDEDEGEEVPGNSNTVSDPPAPSAAPEVVNTAAPEPPSAAPEVVEPPVSQPMGTSATPGLRFGSMDSVPVPSTPRPVGGTSYSSQPAGFRPMVVGGRRRTVQQPVVEETPSRRPTHRFERTEERINPDGTRYVRRTVYTTDSDVDYNPWGIPSPPGAARPGPELRWLDEEDKTSTIYDEEFDAQERADQEREARERAAAERNATGDADMFNPFATVDPPPGDSAGNNQPATDADFASAREDFSQASSQAGGVPQENAQPNAPTFDASEGQPSDPEADRVTVSFAPDDGGTKNERASVGYVDLDAPQVNDPEEDLRLLEEKRKKEAEEAAKKGSATFFADKFGAASAPGEMFNRPSPTMSQPGNKFVPPSQRVPEAPPVDMPGTSSGKDEIEDISKEGVRGAFSWSLKKFVYEKFRCDAKTAILSRMIHCMPMGNYGEWTVSEFLQTCVERPPFLAEIEDCIEWVDGFEEIAVGDFPTECSAFVKHYIEVVNAAESELRLPVSADTLAEIADERLRDMVANRDKQVFTNPDELLKMRGVNLFFAAHKSWCEQAAFWFRKKDSLPAARLSRRDYLLFAKYLDMDGAVSAWRSAWVVTRGVKSIRELDWAALTASEIEVFYHEYNKQKKHLYATMNQARVYPALSAGDSYNLGGKMMNKDDYNTAIGEISKMSVANRGILLIQLFATNKLMVHGQVYAAIYECTKFTEDKGKKRPITVYLDDTLREFATWNPYT